jgi:hypothetical protein
MNRDDIIRMAKEAHKDLVTLDYPGHAGQLDPWTLRLLERFHALAIPAEREKVAAWMRSKSYATGHGDTTEDFLKELEWQVAEREREACAKVAESYEPTCDTCPSGVANAIRARGET